MFNKLPKPVLFGCLGMLGSLLGWLLAEPAISALKPQVSKTSTAVPAAPSLLFPPEIQERLNEAGAHSGTVEIALTWQNFTDLDLHCIEPSGAEVSYRNKRVPSGGWLDVDANVSSYTRTPAEHIVWENDPPVGIYHFFVEHYATHGDPDPTAYKIALKAGDKLTTYEGQLTSSGLAESRARSGKYTFTLSPPPTPQPVPRPSSAPDYRGALIFGVWGALLAIPLGIALLLGQNGVMHRPLWQPKAVATVAGGGLVAGFVSGAVIQLLYGWFAQAQGIAPGTAQRLMGFGLGWGLLGALLGITVGLFIPNVPKLLTGLGGLCGGVLGGLVVGKAMDDFPPENLIYAHGMGAVILGAGIGILLVIAEVVGREAALIIHWGKNEYSRVNLGPVPAVLGSARDAELYLPVEQGFPRVAALVSFVDGKVEMENRLTNSRHTLRNGNKLKLGPLIVEVEVK